MQPLTPAPLGISGARALPLATKATVQGMAYRAALGGTFVVTGCAAGADAAAVAGTLAVGGGLLVFAVGTRTGAGFPRGFVPRHLAGIETQAGVVLFWLAGGPLTVPLVARLARRSLAVVQYLAKHGGTLAAFPAAPRPPRPFGSGPFPSCGSGTWSTVAAAALKGVPVFVAGPVAPSAVLPVAGVWQPAYLHAVAGWSFVPGTPRLL
jgi:hypothetical protein